MKVLHARIVRSLTTPGLVSIRMNDLDEDIRTELTKQGFQPGERVVVLLEEAYERLMKEAK